MDSEYIILMRIYYGIPIISLIAVGICVFRFIRAKKLQKEYPLTYTSQEIRKYKNALIASSVISGVIISNHIGIAILSVIAISYM